MAATTLQDLIDRIKARLGITGDAYDDAIIHCVNRVLGLIGSVDFAFLYNPNGFITINQGIIQYPLADDFRKLDYEHVYFVTGSTRTRLAPAPLTNIVFEPPSDTGTPHFFCVSGSMIVENALRHSIYIGAPTSNIPGEVIYGYWKTIPPVTSTQDVPLIAYIWNSAPLVSGATYFMWKELEQFAKAQDALIEHLADMRIMSNNLVFSGASYEYLLTAQLEGQKS